MIPGTDPNRDKMPKWVEDLLKLGVSFGAGAIVALVLTKDDKGDVIVETGRGSVRKGD